MQNSASSASAEDPSYSLIREIELNQRSGFLDDDEVSVQRDPFRDTGGTHFVISPKEETVIIIMTQKQPFSDKIKRELIPIIYEGL